MSKTQTKIGMTPPHPSEFFRYEILDELALSVANAAEIVDVRRATLSDLVNGNASLAGNGAAHREGFWPEHGHDGDGSHSRLASAKKALQNQFGRCYTFCNL